MVVWLSSPSLALWRAVLNIGVEKRHDSLIHLSLLRNTRSCLRNRIQEFGANKLLVRPVSCWESRSAASGLGVSTTRVRPWDSHPSKEHAFMDYVNSL